MKKHNKHQKILSILMITVFILTVFSIEPANSKKITNKAKKTTQKYEDNYKLENLFKDQKEERHFVKDQIIVKFKEDNKIQFTKTKKGIKTEINTLDKINKEYDLESTEKIFTKTISNKFEDIYKLSFSENTDIFSAIEKYNRLSFVEYAEPNYIYKYCIEPNDPLFPEQWALKNIEQLYPWDGRFNPPPGSFDSDIDGPEAWDITTGDNDIVIAVIDTGVDYTHPDLVDNIWMNDNEIPDNGFDDDNNGYIDDIQGWDFQENDNDPMDEDGHGTFCAGLISAAGDNSKGVSGVCWNCKIMPVKSLLHSTVLAEAIKYATDNGADVISMSYGGYSFSELQKDALNFAYNHNVVLVASSGNDNISRRHYPSGYHNVISVAATDSNDKKAVFSNSGPWIDVAAPGVDVLSLRAKNTDMYGNGTNIINEEYYIASGTSMAAPHITGVAGLLLSYNSSLTPDTIQTIISNSVDNITSEYNIVGRINAYTALLKEPAIVMLDQYVDWRNIKGNITIQGKIWGADFDRYKIEYGIGEKPDTWIEIDEGYNPKEGVLSVLDTTELDEGIYTIRVVVYCNNDVYRDKIWIIVNNIHDELYVDDDNKEGPWTGSMEYPYNRIQDGVDIAGDNDTVFVFNGTYYENVKINGGIKLVGENKNSTVIDSNNSGSSFTVLYDSVLIENFTIRNCGKKLPDAGVEFGKKLKDVTIKNNILRDCYCAIWIEGENTNHKIIGNIVENGTIILFLGPQYNLIRDNVIMDTREEIGIGLSLSYFNTIKGNIIVGHKYGILIGFSIMNTIEGNNISNNDIGLEFVVWGVHTISRNNFIDNRVHAKCVGSRYNRWKGNYWDDWIGLKRPVLKFLPKFISTIIPGIITSFDWRPATEPYDI